jgi:hypothetical protein
VEALLLEGFKSLLEILFNHLTDTRDLESQFLALDKELLFRGLVLILALRDNLGCVCAEFVHIGAASVLAHGLSEEKLAILCATKRCSDKPAIPDELI